MKQLFQLLHQVHAVQAPCWEYLTSLLICKRFKKDQFILKKGQICYHIFYIEKGAVRIYHYNKRGEEVTTWILTEGSIFIAPASFFGQEPSMDYIVALEDTIAHGITYEQLEAVCRFDMEFCLNRIYITERYYIISETTRRRLLEMKNEERYLRLLETNPEWFNRIPLIHLSSYLGMSQPTFDRIRGQVHKASKKKGNK